MMQLLKIIMMVFVVGFLVMLSACSKPSVNPCGLLSVDEVKSIDELVSISKWLPKSKKDSSELCMFTDVDDNRLVMLFYWKDKNIDPRSLLESGMKGDKSNIVSIDGVGESAVAGFSETDGGEVLKMFAAKAAKGTIGIRVKKPTTKDSGEFEKVKVLANKALSRIK